MDRDAVQIKRAAVVNIITTADPVLGNDEQFRFQNRGSNPIYYGECSTVPTHEDLVKNGAVMLSGVFAPTLTIDTSKPLYMTAAGDTSVFIGEVG